MDQIKKIDCREKGEVILEAGIDSFGTFGSPQDKRETISI